MKERFPRIIKRFLLVLTGAVLMAFNINSFVSAGGLIPGGFTGLALLIREVALLSGGIRLPFSLILYILNAVPAIICFRSIGRNFTLYSCLMVLVSGFLTDWIPGAEIGGVNVAAAVIEFLRPHDILLSSVFGGLLNAVSISLCLYADATSGGTDFIAILIAEKYRKDAWNYIFAGNCVILAVAAWLYSLDRALYSIIFQFTTTITLSLLYRGYQQRTLLIITGKPDEIYTLIREKTNHAATLFKGVGSYEKVERVLLYSVVAANEVSGLMTAIKQADEKAFVNVLKTEQLNGRFYHRRRD
ncbi:MAG: YitT family protein [Treponema sp.]|nr:YitT family protein [Treponema sp.]